MINKMKIVLDKFILRFLSDKNYLKIKYRLEMGKKLNLDNPQTFNEKLQWLKLYDRKEIYTTMVDKYEAKKYVADIIGEEYIIPTLGIYDKFDDIDFDSLPSQFVMKCTHDSGGIVICKDKNIFDKEQAKKKINKHLKRNFYKNFREWPYKNVKPRIIIEEFIGENLMDYRIYCFNGKARYIYMYANYQSNCDKPEPKYCNIYDINWKLQEFHQKSIQINEKYNKPKQLEKMQEIAEKLSKNTKFLRVDFYLEKEKILFGEMTFFPGAGFSKFYPEKYDNKLGEQLKI